MLNRLLILICSSRQSFSKGCLQNGHEGWFGRLGITISSDVIIRAFSSPSRVASSSGAELRGDDVEVRASNDVGGSEIVSADNGGRLSCKSGKPSLLAARLALLYNSEAATALELTRCRGSVASAADLVDLRAPVSSLMEVALNIGAFNCVAFLGDIFGGRLKVFGVP